MNNPALEGYGVGPVAVAEGLGCKTVRVTNISMGIEIDAVNEFEEILDLNLAKTLVDA